MHRFSDKETFLLFYLLPIIIDAQRIRKRKKVSDENDNSNGLPRKPSFDERVETFILHVPVRFSIKYF